MEADKCNYDGIKIIESIHLSCARNYANYKAINAVKHPLINKHNFWLVAESNAYDMAVIEWCKLFGNDSEKTHWKNSGVSGIHDLKKQLLPKIGMTEIEWADYRKQLLDYRNKNATHVDLDGWQRNYPYIQNSIELVYASYDLFVDHNRLVNNDLRAETRYQFDIATKAINLFLEHALKLN
jgi:hypothetical protein